MLSVDAPDFVARTASVRVVAGELWVIAHTGSRW